MREGINFLPLLMDLWQYSNPEKPDKPSDWLKAYTSLQQDAVCQEKISRRWNNPLRTGDQETWEFSSPNKKIVIEPNIDGQPHFDKECGKFVRSGLIRSRFGEAVSNDLIPERFDFHAAQYFMEADKLELTADQKQRSRRLKRLRQTVLEERIRTTPENPARFGPPSLNTLCKGPDTDFEILNGMGMKLNKPPVHRPPFRLKIHLCWYLGYPALEEVNRKRPAISTLQGLIALILDDWRAVIQGLPVDLFLHRDRPWLDAQLDGERGGPPWRTAWERKKPMPPAAPVVQILFERPNRVDLACEPSSWLPHEKWEYEKHSASNCDWWCGFVLENDLPALKINPNGQTWQITEKSRFRPSLNHLIMVDPDAASGTIGRVNHTLGGTGGIEPIVDKTGLSANYGEQHFEQLRQHLITLLLQEMEQRIGSA